MRQTLAYLDMPVLAQPEAYIGDAAKLFDESGHLKNESTQKFLEKFIDSFSDWIEIVAVTPQVEARRQLKSA